jgi:hypothetical protein
MTTKTNVAEFENLKPIEPYTYADNNGSSTSFFEFTLFKSIKTPEDWNKLTDDWENIDQALRLQIEDHKNIFGYSLCVQVISMKFLDKVLLKLKNSERKNDAIQYYLGILIQEKNPYWPVLTKSLLYLRGKIDQDAWEKSKSYIVSSAQNYLKENSTPNESRNGMSQSSRVKEFIQQRLLEAKESLSKLN